jgi:hypothetical protein
LSPSDIILNFEANFLKSTLHKLAENVNHRDFAHVLAGLSRLCWGNQSEHKGFKQVRDAWSGVPTSHLGCLSTDLTKHITPMHFLSALQWCFKSFHPTCLCSSCAASMLTCPVTVVHIWLNHRCRDMLATRHLFTTFCMFIVKYTTSAFKNCL